MVINPLTCDEWRWWSQIFISIILFLQQRSIFTWIRLWRGRCPCWIPCVSRHFVFLGVTQATKEVTWQSGDSHQKKKLRHGLIKREMIHVTEFDSQVTFVGIFCPNFPPLFVDRQLLKAYFIFSNTVFHRISTCTLLSAFPQKNPHPQGYNIK